MVPPLILAAKMVGILVGWMMRPARMLRAGLALLLLTAGAAAQDRAQLFATRGDGFGRLVLSFPGRNELPEYRLKMDNGVLALEFDEPIDFLLPDVAVTLPEFVAAARIDPDRRGLRFGLRLSANVNRLEAGERLFLDLLPPDWRGLPPGLPPEVVAELAQRAQAAAANAEQLRKAEAVKQIHPEATLRVGRNPTFTRVEFNWNADTEAKFSLLDRQAEIAFDWPVPIDLYPLKSDLPEAVLSTGNLVTPDGSSVVLTLGPGTEPRFYVVSKRQFVLDFDVDPAAGMTRALAAEETQRLLAGGAAPAATDAAAPAAPAGVAPVSGAQLGLTPQVSRVGGTVRITFPFEQDTASAVFKRGRTVWMLFDTGVAISEPARDAVLASIADGFAVVPAGDTMVVRLDLSSDRLATLGSEGRAWVLSIGDVLLSPTEPVTLSRHRDAGGAFEMVADLSRASRRHQFRDPEVGDVLEVVTAFAPARGLVRSLDFVDFSALRSVHGLVLRPKIEGIDVAVGGGQAVITARGGLRLSELAAARSLDSGNAPEFRRGYLDLNADRQDDPAVLVQRRESLMARAAESEGRQRDEARLGLARFFVANRFAQEAIGVLAVLEKDLQTEDLRAEMRLLRAAASVLAQRPDAALAALDAAAFAEQVDALMWRGLARALAADITGARSDLLASEAVLENYPPWLRTEFVLTGARVALEAKDLAMAERFLGRAGSGALDQAALSRYQLLTGRLAEAQGRADEALDIYGQVITAEVPPTRAEAVYRTLRVLDASGRLDLPKAIETLSAEVLMWRGDALETGMLTMLADLYFRHADYREAFQTVRQAARHAARGASVDKLLKQAETVFADLYLDGGADVMGDLQALALYYDFRELTPPGVEGDEMIRKLAQRLVKVDLLPQAAELIDYQIEYRLKGAAQAQAAADLAVIRIADRDPEAALRALKRTRLAELPPELERQRRILEGRALIDAGREDLAIDLLSRLEGRDADLLRVDGYWRTGQYATAAELLEGIYSEPGADAPLSQPARMNIVRAGVGFVMAGDMLGLSRLRAKFSDRLAQSAEWPLFDFVTNAFTPTSAEFKEVARQVSGIDSLSAFLGAYRERYSGDASLVPVAATRRGTV